MNKHSTIVLQQTPRPGYGTWKPNCQLGFGTYIHVMSLACRESPWIKPLCNTSSRRASRTTVYMLRALAMILFLNQCGALSLSDLYMCEFTCELLSAWGFLRGTKSCHVTPVPSIWVLRCSLTFRGCESITLFRSSV